MTTFAHVILTRDVDNIPQEFVGKHAASWKPTFLAGTRLRIDHQTHGPSIIVRPYISGGCHICQWLQLPSKGEVIEVRMMPTDRNIKELGVSTIAGRKARAEQRLSENVYQSISSPIIDFQSVYEATDSSPCNIIRYFYNKGIFSLDDLREADRSLKADRLLEEDE